MAKATGGVEIETRKKRKTPPPRGEGARRRSQTSDDNDTGTATNNGANVGGNDEGEEDAGSRGANNNDPDNRGGGANNNGPNNGGGGGVPPGGRGGANNNGPNNGGGGSGPPGGGGGVPPGGGGDGSGDGDREEGDPEDEDREPLKEPWIPKVALRPEKLVAYPSPSGERSLNSALRKGYEFTSIAAISRNDGVIRTRKTMILACLVTTAMNTKGFDARMRTAGRGANRASESRNWARMDRWMCMNSPSGSNMFVVYQGDQVNNNQGADSLIRDSGAIRERNGRFFVVRPDDRPQRSLSLSPEPY